MLADVDARPRDLGAIVAGLGPGPFTGLRVGLVTAATMGQVLGIPTYGVCSLDGIGTRRPPASRCWSPPTRAARRSTGPSTTAPASGSPGPRWPRRRWPPRAPGSWARRSRSATARTGTPTCSDLPVRVEPRYPDGRRAGALAAERIRAGAPGEPLTPLYLRRPDAVAADRPQAGAAVSAADVDRFRWWHIDEVLPIEADLFGAEQWSPAMFWNELANGHYYLVAADVDGDGARLRRAGRRPAGRGVGAEHRGPPGRPAPRRRAGAAGGAARRGGPARRPQTLLEVAVDNAAGPAALRRRTASSRSACGAATTNRATPTRW